MEVQGAGDHSDRGAYISFLWSYLMAEHSQQNVVYEQNSRYFMSWGVSPILHLLYTARSKICVKQVSNRCELGVKVDFEVSYRCKLSVKAG